MLGQLYKSLNLSNERRCQREFPSKVIVNQNIPLENVPIQTTNENKLEVKSLIYTVKEKITLITLQQTE